jgi:hypothetical protein
MKFKNLNQDGSITKSARVAQSVEQRTRNAQVRSSNLLPGSKNRQIEVHWRTKV